MKTFSTPFGQMAAIFKNGYLASLKFSDKSVCEEKQTAAEQEICALVKNFLENYFKGKLVPVPPLQPCGTDFQKKVWQLLAQIPAGQTISYSKLGLLYCQVHNKERICSRAIGHAVGLNPFMIIIPCHRVIRANGSLGNYAAGIERKEKLLEHERRFFQDKIS